MENHNVFVLTAENLSFRKELYDGVCVFLYEDMCIWRAGAPVDIRFHRAGVIYDCELPDVCGNQTQVK